MPATGHGARRRFVMVSCRDVFGHDQLKKDRGTFMYTRSSDLTTVTRYQPVTYSLPSIKAVHITALGHPLPTRYLPVTLVTLDPLPTRYLPVTLN